MFRHFLGAESGDFISGNRVENFDRDRMATLKDEATIGQGIGSTPNDDGLDRDAIPFGDLEGAGFPRTHLVGRRACPLWKHHDRISTPNRAIAMAHHGLDAHRVAAAERNVITECHVPSDTGDAKIFQFGNPSEMALQSKENQDVQE